MRLRRCSQRPVSSGRVSRWSPSILMRPTPFSVARRLRPSRSMYSASTRRSMVAARVAGVPMPASFIASAASSSSTSLPAVSIARRSVPSEYLAGGLVRLASASASVQLHHLAHRQGRQRLLGLLVARPGLLEGIDALRRRRRASRPRSSPCRGCGRGARPPASRRRCARSAPPGGRRPGSAARPCRRSARSSRPRPEMSWSPSVGMIAWWSPTRASLTTRPSGRRSRPEHVARRVGVGRRGGARLR